MGRKEQRPILPSRGNKEKVRERTSLRRRRIPCDKPPLGHQTAWRTGQSFKSILPFLLSQNRSGDSCATLAHLGRSALQPFLQCTASGIAVHCNRHRSALRPTPNILATAAADVCGKILCAQQIALLRGYHYFRTGFLQSFSCNCELGGSCRGSALHHYHQFAMEGFHGGLCEWFQ